MALKFKMVNIYHDIYCTSVHVRHIKCRDFETDGSCSRYSLTHCGTKLCHRNWTMLVQIMACCLMVHAMTSTNVDKLTVMSWRRTHVGCNLSEEISVKWSSPKLLPDPPVIHHSTETLSKSFIQHFPGKIFMQMTKSWGVQAALQVVFSIYLCFCHYVPIIVSSWNFQELLPMTKVRSRSEVKGQGHRGENPSQSFPDFISSLNSDMMMKWCTQLDVARWGALLFFNVICQISRSQGSQNCWIWPKLRVSGL